MVTDQKGSEAMLPWWSGHSCVRVAALGPGSTPPPRFLLTVHPRGQQVTLLAADFYSGPFYSN